MGEEKLISGAKAGDGEAFGKLYDRYFKPIYRYIFLRVGGRKADTEDLSHQVFLSAWQNVKNYEERGLPFSSWLYRIAHNAVVDYYRSYRPAVDIEMVNENEFAEVPKFGEKVDKMFELEKIKVALTKLEPDQQNVLVMKFVNDLTNKEIAVALGKSEGAIRVVQHRALKSLKKQIQNGGPINPTTKEV